MVSVVKLYFAQEKKSLKLKALGTSVFMFDKSIRNKSALINVFTQLNWYIFNYKQHTTWILLILRYLFRQLHGFAFQAKYQVKRVEYQNPLVVY